MFQSPSGIRMPPSPGVYALIPQSHHTNFPSYLCGGLTEYMPPSLESPPLSVHRFSEPAFSAGIEKHHIDGVPIKIFSMEKTIADCFKLGNAIGKDVVEALKLSAERKQFNLEALLTTARRCRTERVMIAYLEVIL